MIAPKATCCTNILRYGLPEENAEVRKRSARESSPTHVSHLTNFSLAHSIVPQFQCVTYEGDSAALYGLDSGQLYQVEGEAWVVGE